MIKRNMDKGTKPTIEEGMKMKKLIVLGVMLLVGIFSIGAAYASSINKDIAVTLNVDPNFTFALDTYAINMGTLALGATGGGTITMYCGTNQNNPWTIQVKSSKVLSGTNEIPLTNFKFVTYGVGDEKGVGTYVDTQTALTEVNQTAYTAAASEKSDTYVTVCMGLELFIPWNTTAGAYGSTVTATMTE
jgi:hypothetical protein